MLTMAEQLFKKVSYSFPLMVSFITGTPVASPLFYLVIYQIFPMMCSLFTVQAMTVCTGV